MSHERAGESDEWYTPKYIFDGLGVVFDLDVACPLEGPLHTPARAYFSDGALIREWHGFVWMNAPFGHQSTKRRWLRKFLDHGNGIALIPDRTSAPWWQEMVAEVDAIMFMSPKVKFERPDGSLGQSPGNGTCLIASGQRAANVLVDARALGFVIRI